MYLCDHNQFLSICAALKVACGLAFSFCAGDACTCDNTFASFPHVSFHITAFICKFNRLLGAMTLGHRAFGPEQPAAGGLSKDMSITSRARFVALDQRLFFLDATLQ